MSNTVLRRTMLAAVICGAAFALTACDSGNAATETAAPTAAAPIAPATFDLTGSVTITDWNGVASTRKPDNLAVSKTGCFGWDGYSDLKVGAPVVVYGPDSKMVGVGAITDSVSHPKDDSSFGVTIRTDTCEMHFTVPDVPTGLGIYSYEVSHRGKLPITEANAVAGLAAATLG